MKFQIEKKLKGSLGRVGILETPHGVVHTPAFVPVATKASVKALTPEMLSELGAEIVLGNTYHLYLQPGDEVIRDAGGLAEFMNWRALPREVSTEWGPTMTDSGGFQVFSLGAAYGKEISKITKEVADPSLLLPERIDDERAPRLAKIGADGVSFKSHLDGSIHYITPEKSIQIQHNLGADIIFAFDECLSPLADLDYQSESLERTHRWAKRSLLEHQRLSSALSNFSLPNPSPARAPERGLHDLEIEKDLAAPALFGIVQGGRDEKLRKRSAKFVSGLDFDGFGIGGSFAKVDMSLAVRWVNEILSEAKPRHLLGIGEPEDIFMGVENGVDLFDCVLPTRNGRNGTLYTKQGKVNIMNAKYARDFSPIEEDCGCYVCSAPPDFSPLNPSPSTGRDLHGLKIRKGFTRAYVSHLFRGKEMLAGTLATIHNLFFIVNLVKKIRHSILEDTFFRFKEEFLREYKAD
jgi:queuine tRNA-ribosyltransferase